MNNFLHFLFWQDCDDSCLGKMKLEEQLSGVLKDLDFFKALHAEVHAHASIAFSSTYCHLCEVKFSLCLCLVSHLSFWTGNARTEGAAEAHLSGGWDG